MGNSKIDHTLLVLEALPKRWRATWQALALNLLTWRYVLCPFPLAEDSKSYWIVLAKFVLARGAPSLLEKAQSRIWSWRHTQHPRRWACGARCHRSWHRYFRRGFSMPPGQGNAHAAARNSIHSSISSYPSVMVDHHDCQWPWSQVIATWNMKHRAHTV